MGWCACVCSPGTTQPTPQRSLGPAGHLERSFACELALRSWPAFSLESVIVKSPAMRGWAFIRSHLMQVLRKVEPLRHLLPLGHRRPAPLPQCVCNPQLRKSIRRGLRGW